MYQLRKLTKRFLERFRTNIEDPTTRTVVKNCVRDWFSWEARGTKKAKSPESDSPSEMLVSAGDQPEGQRTGDSWVLVRGNVASDWGLAYLRPTLTTGLPSSSRCGMYEVRSYFSCLSYDKSEEEKISMRWGKTACGVSHAWMTFNGNCWPKKASEAKPGLWVYLFHVPFPNPPRPLTLLQRAKGSADDQGWENYLASHKPLPNRRIWRLWKNCTLRGCLCLWFY